MLKLNCIFKSDFLQISNNQLVHFVKPSVFCVLVPRRVSTFNWNMIFCINVSVVACSLSTCPLLPLQFLYIQDVLQWRAQATPDHPLFLVLNAKVPHVADDAAAQTNGHDTPWGKMGFYLYFIFVSTTWPLTDQNDVGLSMTSNQTFLVASALSHIHSLRLFFNS